MLNLFRFCYDDYHRYLASREWAAKRGAVRRRSAGWCERHPFGQAPMKAVHHLTYQHLFDEPLQDLQAVCGPCHAYLSGIIEVDPISQLQMALDLDEAA